jgi:signal transduction histidine kinase
MRTFAVPAYRKGLELAYEVHPEVPDGLIGDVGRLRQIMVNLVGNAIKFTTAGEVVLRIATLPSATVTRDGTYVLHVSVTDTGIGKRSIECGVY